MFAPKWEPPFFGMDEREKAASQKYWSSLEKRVGNPLAHEAIESWAKGRERWTSLADMHQILSCTFVVVSSPERGTNKSTGKHDAETMRMIESLSSHFRENVAFVNAVDFAGSSSGDFCSKRIREVHEGRVKTGKDDFEGGSHDLREKFPEADWPPELKDTNSIANSFWFCFWRGKVSGALASAFNTMPTTEYRDTRPLECMTKAAQVPSMISCHFRCVVALSLDGGPITQVEKREIPSICKSVMSDIARRNNKWSKHCALLWCHFATVADLLASLDGKRNLRIDHCAENQIGQDIHGMPLTFCADDRNADDDTCTHSLFKDSLDSFINASGTDTVFLNLQCAAKGNDLSAIKYILARHPELINHFEKSKYFYDETFIEMAPLHVACLFGNLEATKTLIEFKADVHLKSSVAGEPASAVLAGIISGTASTSGALNVLRLMVDSGGFNTVPLKTVSKSMEKLRSKSKADACYVDKVHFQTLGQLQREALEVMQSVVDGHVKKAADELKDLTDAEGKIKFKLFKAISDSPDVEGGCLSSDAFKEAICGAFTKEPEPAVWELLEKVGKKGKEHGIEFGNSIDVAALTKLLLEI
eukprot:TRINITY_DN7048_c0_g1_i1.p1 TRINITY_DN7048_c0_g1~~TRINITY_DN7048_c0_g1_i1.p1  ORF type:complete len:590 (+),score=99.28 TRINITY_DN7048_c0_g1_i1:80-1849(+)